MKTNQSPLLITLLSAFAIGAQAQEPPRPPTPAAPPQPPPAHPFVPQQIHPARPQPPDAPHAGRGDRMPREREGARPERREGASPRRPEAPREPQAFLGVVTSPAPAVLSTQLGLAEGFGLVVLDVLPGSPAAAAGLQKHDVLKLLDDQLLVDPHQLSALVRGRGKGSEATLTVLRKGQEQKFAVKIGEHMAAAGRTAPSASPGPHPRILPLEPQQAHEFAERLQRRAQEAGRDVRERAEKMRENAERTRSEIEERMRKRREGETNDRGAAAPAEDILREARPGGGREVRAFSDSSATTWDGAKARLHMKDGDGEIEVLTENGHRTLTAKDAQGQVVFSGPVDTEEQRSTLPESIRRKLSGIRTLPSAKRREGPRESSSDPAVQ